jgi:hypothetical protein
LAENVSLQIIASLLSVVILTQWSTAAFIADAPKDPIPYASSKNLEFLTGTVMLSIAHTYVVPSWINVKVY